MKKSSTKGGRAHPFAYDGLDRVMHERARLGVLTSLLAHPKGLSFAMLRELCGLTDGNLSRHLEVLETAKLIEITRTTAHTRPLSLCRITPDGRKRFLSYLSTLEQVLLDAAASPDIEDSREQRLLRLQGR